MSELGAIDERNPRYYALPKRGEFAEKMRAHAAAQPVVTACRRCGWRYRARNLAEAREWFHRHVAHCTEALL